MEHGHGTEMAPEAVSGMSMDEKMHASVGMEMWSGATSFACSSAAAWRAGWLVAIFMVATPWALVAYNRATAAAAACVAAGGAGVDEHMKRRHVAVVVHCAVAALALFLGFFAEGGLRECYGTTYFIDDGLKWLLVAVNCLVAVALALTSASPPAPAPAASPTPSLSSGVGFGGGRSALAGARDALMALTRRSALLWGYTYAVAALSVFLSVTGVWGHMQCFARSTFFSHEVGHIGPASMWLAEALLVLPTALKLQRSESAIRSGAPSPVNRMQRKQGRRGILLELQGREGVAFFCLAGVYFLIQTLTGRHHAILGPILEKDFYSYIDVSGADPKAAQEALWHYVKDQQHAFQALVWMTSGVVGLALRQKENATGIHFVFASMAQTAMIFFHPQINAHAAVLHKMHALFLLASSVFRYTERLVEFSLLASISSGLFLSSSSCLTMMAGFSHIDEIGYMLSVIALVCLAWSWFFTLFYEPGETGATEVAERGTMAMKAGFE